MSDLKKIKDEYLSKLKRQSNLSEINEIKSNLFGKNGLISSQFKKIGSIDENESWYPQRLVLRSTISYYYYYSYYSK